MVTESDPLGLLDRRRLSATFGYLRPLGELGGYGAERQVVVADGVN